MGLFRRRLNYTYPEIIYGKGPYLYSKEGTKWIDAVGGAMVAILGHGLSDIAFKISEHLSKLTYLHSAQFTCPLIEEYAAELVSLTNYDYQVFFVSGGSEATESVMKFVWQYFRDLGKPSKKKLIYRKPGYHGNTLGALSLTAKPSFRALCKEYLLEFPYVHAPFCYHCPYGYKSSKDCHLECAEELEQKILQENPDTVAAFIMEPIIGASAGAVVPPFNYIRRVHEICKKYNVLLIFDEVMVGFGRTGNWFAFQEFGIYPDIFFVSKSLSAGFAPLAAVFVKSELVDVIKNISGKFQHGFTYMNNYSSIVAGKVVLEYIRANNLVDNVKNLSKIIENRLDTLREKFDFIGDVRGKGCLWGIEVVKDKEKRSPFPRELQVAEHIVNIGLKKGINLYFSIEFTKNEEGDAIMISPPYNIGEVELFEIFDKLDKVFQEFSRRLKHARI
jgi:adenosylmethionine-8-amino-7-oxononanoate aminotransferase